MTDAEQAALVDMADEASRSAPGRSKEFAHLMHRLLASNFQTPAFAREKWPLERGED